MWRGEVRCLESIIMGVAKMVGYDNSWNCESAVKEFIEAKDQQIAKLVEALGRAEIEVSEYADISKPPIRGRAKKSLRIISHALKSYGECNEEKP